MKTFIFTLLVCFSGFFSFGQNAESAQFYFNKGQADFNGRLYLSASKNFNIAIHHNPEFTEAFIQNGKAFLEMSKVYEAAQNFGRAYELQPGNAEVIKELANLYFNSRQYNKAMELVAKCTNCENADLLLGMGYYHLEDYAKAAGYLQKAIQKNDRDAQTFYSLGRTYLELENSTNAISHFEKATELDATKYQWKYELGLIYYNQTDYNNALKYFDAAIASGLQKNNDFHENYGFAQLYKGDVDGGMQSLEIVIQRKPNNTQLLNNIAYAMYSTNQFENAINYYEKLLIINPKDASSLYMAGISFQKIGQKVKGQSLCDKAIAMDPSLAKNRQKQEMN